MLLALPQARLVWTTAIWMVFYTGLRGSEPEHAEAVEQGILELLAQVADNGIDETPSKPFCIKSKLINATLAVMACHMA